MPFHCDVTQESDVEAMFAAAIEAFGRVDAVLDVAGIAGGQQLADVTLDEYDKIMAVDLKGVFLGTKHGIKAMLPTGGGAIVNWSSTGGMNGSVAGERVLGCESGRHLVHQGRAIEYGDQGIRANAICPGFVETEMSGGRARAIAQVVQGKR